MRHDPAIASIVIMLRELKMHGMAQAVAELAEQGAPYARGEPILRMTGVDGQHASAGFALP